MMRVFSITVVFLGMVMLAACGSAAKRNPPRVSVGSIGGSELSEAVLEPEDAEEEDPDFADFDDEFGEEEGPEAGQQEVFDPLSGYNRMMFSVNDKFYYWLAKPVSQAYGFVVPEPARVCIGKAARNFHFPVRFVNSVLQLKFKRSVVELGRFVVNSTVGIGGLFDPADHFFKWRSSPEDFGQTLGRYGVGDGFPLVLPLLGPTNLRDGLGMVPEIVFSPLRYLADFPTQVAARTGEQMNWTSLHIGEYESIQKDALDPYTFMRDAYKQRRDSMIRE